MARILVGEQCACVLASACCGCPVAATRRGVLHRAAGCCTVLRGAVQQLQRSGLPRGTHLPAWHGNDADPSPAASSICSYITRPLANRTTSRQNSILHAAVCPAAPIAAGEDSPLRAGGAALWGQPAGHGRPVACGGRAG